MARPTLLPKVLESVLTIDTHRAFITAKLTDITTHRIIITAKKLPVITIFYYNTIHYQHIALTV